ncbi:MAG: alpha/beta fold hydrolase [Actinocrinis sp.]
MSTGTEPRALRAFGAAIPCRDRADWGGMSHTTIVTTGDRRITVEEWGAPDGIPVLLMHGTPGSRLGPRPRASVLYRLGIRLVVYDRPGYGGSDRKPGRRVADGATDAAVVADRLGIGRFAVVGRSGGGPHALACAALLPDRVTCAAVLVSIAPRDAPGLEWLSGMNAANRQAYAIAEAGMERLTVWYESQAAATRADPRTMLAFLNPHLSEPDRRVVADYGIRQMLESNFSEAFRDSAAGWIDDTLAFTTPWGFDPAAIDMPVLLWHGAEDEFAPIGHTRWLATQMRHAALVVAFGAAHFGALAVLPQVLGWAVRGDLGPGALAGLGQIG